jgi:septal ring factor EnvC (AmiA/AmiB activator)
MDDLSRLQSNIETKQAEIEAEEKRLAKLRGELADLRRDFAHACDDIPYLPPGGQRVRTGSIRVDVARIVAASGERGILRSELRAAIGDARPGAIHQAVTRLVQQGAVRADNGRVYPVDDE